MTISVPDGKTIAWKEVDGNTVAVLVDELKVDNRPVTERIKTFEDAYLALGDEHPFVEAYNALFMDNGKENTCDLPMWKDLFAYARLRIIVAALNEGWEPKFTEDENRYFPCFYFYTKEKYDKLDDEEKGRCVLRPCGHSSSCIGFVVCVASSDASYSHASFGSRLAFRTRELAEYAGRQFIEEWCDFI